MVTTTPASTPAPRTVFRVRWGEVARTVTVSALVGATVWAGLTIATPSEVPPVAPPVQTYSDECKNAALELYDIAYVTIHHYAIPSIDSSVTIDEFEFSQSILAEAEALSRVRFAELTECAGSDIPFETIDE